jgi:hypothetical protein
MALRFHPVLAFCPAAAVQARAVPCRIFSDRNKTLEQERCEQVSLPISF